VRRFGLLAALAAARASRGRAAEDPPGIDVERDVAYGSDPRQRLDVYRRAGGVAGAPVLLMVHGGGWRRGDKSMATFVGHKVHHWAGQGWVVAAADYRLVPDADPLQQADDVGRALAFVQRNAARWGGDGGRVALLGHSAGAHLVALVNADAAIAGAHGAQPWRAVVAIDSAAFDVVSIMEREHHALYDVAFGADPARWRDASPLHRLQAAPAAPTLLVCSAWRADAGAAARAFADRIVGLGGRAEVLPVPLNHLRLNDELGLPGEYTETVDRFLREAGP
jgi:arylformamidase